ISSARLMDSNGDPWLCFANLNSSCKRLNRTFSETAVLNSLLASISLVTVTLNLLVIVSISHFRQLHTPTNALLLSLAVSDLLVGLLVMPIEGLRYVEMCWRLGKLMCVLAPYVSYSVLSASVGNMVLISIDRYLAICDPLLYSNKVTLKRAKIAVCVCWAGSVLHNGCILIGHLKHPERYSSCHGECVVVIDHISGTVDLFITFFAPCTIMVVMYMRVFAAAVAQMRVIRLQNAAVAVNTATTVKKSEWKAARTLGIVVSVFLMCFCPYYYPAFAGEDTSNNSSYFAALVWIMMINSCMNPLIYALFYPWFRRSIKLIITLRILRSYSITFTLKKI
uniref:G-protein coupled receptors family 1 profile domain-containing protein n=1 Tax=Tetraodon nigroviridis TaxID=99883 RepID=H3C6S2_TETNG